MALTKEKKSRYYFRRRFGMLIRSASETLGGSSILGISSSLEALKGRKFNLT